MGVQIVAVRSLRVRNVQKPKSSSARTSPWGGCGAKTSSGLVDLGAAGVVEFPLSDAVLGRPDFKAQERHGEVDGPFRVATGYELLVVSVAEGDLGPAASRNLSQNHLLEQNPPSNLISDTASWWSLRKRPLASYLPFLATYLTHYVRKL